jgi:hypothetical protein
VVVAWLSEIAFGLCPIFKAIADTLDHHFDISVFRNLNAKFWDRDTSSLYAKRIFGYKVDGWHLSLSAMIVCFIIAVVFHEPKTEWYYEFIIGGVYWNLCFNLFYNKVFR